MRIGILGCAGVAEYALIEPAKDFAEVVIAAVASRDPARAADYARKHAIPLALSYEDLIAHPELDAIYIPLPNALHYEWAVAAIEAGRPVLCEKPLAANADQAQALATLAEQRGVPLVEAFHWRYHPIAHRMMEIVEAGTLGALRSVQLEFLIPTPMVPPDNIRHDFALGGGSLMDTGSYCINLIRLVLGEPSEIVSAQATVIGAQIDGAMVVEMRHPGGEVSGFHCSMIHPGKDFVVNARIEGDRGTLFVEEPFMPQWGNFLELEAGGTAARETATTRTTYHFQLAEFVEVVKGLRPIRTPASDAVANMRVVDAIYRKAGLLPRGGTA